jgi:acid stress-induced BolA-like protein IbaG/YrbA
MGALEKKVKRIIEGGLEQGVADLETLSDGYIVGHVISPEFEDVAYAKRRRMVWKLLEESLSPKELRQISVMLTYTPNEWGVELDV